MLFLIIIFAFNTIVLNPLQKSQKKIWTPSLKSVFAWTTKMRNTLHSWKCDRPPSGANLGSEMIARSRSVISGSVSISRFRNKNCFYQLTHLETLRNCSEHLFKGGCRVAQRKHSCFPPSSPGFQIPAPPWFFPFTV